MEAACDYCGEIIDNDADDRLCAPCFEAATLETEHEAGDHDDPCYSCNVGVLSAAQRKRADEPSYEERQAARGDWLRQVRKEDDDQ